MTQRSKANKNRPTLGDIARRAGVSVTTASLVLGDKAAKHRIAEETYQRVKQAAAELDYAPNLLVHSLQRGSTHILSFFNGYRHRGAQDLYMDTLSTAIERAGGRYGYDILVNCDFNRTPEEMYRHLNGGVVDGVLFFAPLPNDPLLPFLRASRLPTVLLNARDETGVLPCVKDDVESGMRQVAERLLALGHRRIAVFSENVYASRDTQERIAWLQTFLQKGGVVIPERWILPYEGDTRASFLALMREPEPPTALFCWRDRIAYYLLEHCEKLGIAVPDQLSVIGYDGLHWPAATRHTAASVKVDLDALADAAIRLLLQTLQGSEPDSVNTLLPVTLMEGTTLAPPLRVAYL